MKKIISLTLCFLFVLGITACGTDENSSAPDASSEESSLIMESSSEDDVTSTESKEEKSSSSKPKNSSSKIKNNSGKNSSGTNSTVSTKRYPSRQKTITVRRANQSWFKVLGRGDNISPYSGISINWSCASVEFDVDCVGELGVDFVRGSGSNPVYVEIYLDGKLLEERTKIDTGGVFTIAEDLEPGIHRVKIVRQSDAECPSLTLSRVYVQGTMVMKAPENKALYIEAIGDSALIGWGVRLNDDFYTDFKQNSEEKQPIARNRENEDGTLAYTYVAAEKLNADTYTLAKQGAGIAATYHKTTTKLNGTQTTICSERGGLLPTMYNYHLPSGTAEYKAIRLPDVIVIDAGAADLSKSCQQSVLDGEVLGIDTMRAIEISTEFLNKLKRNNPDAKIIWCYGLTNGDSVADYIKKVVDRAGGEKEGIYTLQLAKSNRNGYPSAKEYAAAADLLVAKIKQITK